MEPVLNETNDSAKGRERQEAMDRYWRDGLLAILIAVAGFLSMQIWTNTSRLTALEVQAGDGKTTMSDLRLHLDGQDIRMNEFDRTAATTTQQLIEINAHLVQIDKRLENIENRGRRNESKRQAAPQPYAFTGPPAP